MISAAAFVAVAALLCVAAVAAVLATAQVYLSGPAAIEHDGLARGQRAPHWSLPDADGTARQSPPVSAPLQLVVFADHSLKSFPSVLDGLRALRALEPQVEIIVLLRGRNELAAPLLAMLGLDAAVVTGTPALYARYNVRVAPFVIFVGSDGLIRASSLVNEDWQIAKLRQVASLPATPLRRAPSPRTRRRAAAPA